MTPSLAFRVWADVAAPRWEDAGGATCKNAHGVSENGEVKDERTQGHDHFGERANGNAASPAPPNRGDRVVDDARHHVRS
jgi:hypothetical protein